MPQVIYDEDCDFLLPDANNIQIRKRNFEVSGLIFGFLALFGFLVLFGFLARTFFTSPLI